MKTQVTSREYDVYRKTGICMVLSLFYFAMLAYPFGVSSDGYVAQRALIAGVIFFVISIPAWVVNVRKEISAASEKTAASEAVAEEDHTRPIAPVAGEQVA